MSAVTCPACQKALPESVVTGPAQAVVRCEGCSTLLLWSHGKVVRSARSGSPSTLMGVPVQKTPLPPPKKTLMGIPIPPAPAAADDQLLDDSDMIATKPPPMPGRSAPAPVPPKVEPPKVEAPRPTQTLGKIAATRRDPLLPPKPKPVEAKPVEAKPVPAKKPEDSAKSVIAAAIAPPSKQMPGPMEDPLEWFDDTKVGDMASEDDEVTTVGSAPGLDPLPPIQPPKSETPAARSLFAMSTQESGKNEVANKKTVMAPAPSLKKEDTPAPSPKKENTPAPLFAKKAETKIKMEPPKMAVTVQAEAPKMAVTVQAEAPKLEKPRDPSPLPLPLPAAPAHKPSPTPMGGSVEPVLDLSPDKRRPPLVYAAIGTAGALLILAVTLVAMRGESPKEKPAAPPPVAVEKTTPPAPPAPPPAAEPVVEKAPPVVEKAPPVVEKAPPVVAKAPPEEPLPPPTRAPRQPVAAVGEEQPPRPRKRLGGKKVVLEYDAPKRTAPVKAEEDPAQVERAREAYKRGNEKLFSGNSSAAVAAYKESLSIYPGYVAGYRGLGLAYLQSGNNDEALRALRTYVKTVPNAADVALIMKRIERLEKNPQN